jgi:hypothetical protein
MMRKLFVLGMMAGLVGLGGFVRDASAGATIDLLFVGVNGGPIAPTNTVTVAGGDTLTMGLRLRNDQTITVFVFSANYDLDGDNELDVVSVFQWSGVPIFKTGPQFFDPVAGLSPTTPTFVGSFQGTSTDFAVPRALPITPVGGYQMGTVVWKVTGNVNSDGADIISGLLNAGIDGASDAGFNFLVGVGNLGGIPSLVFNSATVNVIPEPGTASLLGLGLVGIVLMGRRSRS